MVSAAAERAAAALSPCVLIAGEVVVGAREMRTMGIEAAYAVHTSNADAPTGEVTEDELRRTAARVARVLALVTGVSEPRRSPPGPAAAKARGGRSSSRRGPQPAGAGSLTGLELDDHPPLQHQIRAAEVPGRRRAGPARRGQRERRIGHHPERLARRAEGAEVALDDDGIATVGAFAQPPGPSWVQLDGDHPGTRIEQRQGQAAGAGAEVDDEIAGSDVGGGDNRLRPPLIEPVPPPTPPGHGAP